MVDWFLNPALTRFRSEVNARYPNRDKKSDGTIGDAIHQAEKSDHNPDADGSVDAWDMDVDLNGDGNPYGNDVWKVINAALKHESIQYVIYNRQITSRSWGLGVWRPYDGPSPHTEHVHFSTRDAYENSNKPWFPEEDMLDKEKDTPIIQSAVHGTVIGKTGITFGVALDRLRPVPDQIAALNAKVDALAAKETTVSVKVDVSDPTVLDAIAKRVADELAKRIVE